MEGDERGEGERGRTSSRILRPRLDAALKLLQRVAEALRERREARREADEQRRRGWGRLEQQVREVGAEVLEEVAADFGRRRRELLQLRERACSK